MLTWTVEHNAAPACCALELGVAAEALRMTAEYTTKREQFGKADRLVPGGRGQRARTPSSTSRRSA